MITIQNRYTNDPILTVESDTLRYANLRYANLRYADLTRADLRVADLAGANLTRANLTRANLTHTNLSGADLAGADLTRANLTRANLTDANLTDANLAGANLAGANLSGANLRSADLTGANLTRANLSDAYLDSTRDDIYAILSESPSEAAGLLAALDAGRVDGSTYEGECACLVGTIANLRGCPVEQIGKDSTRPAERWFLAIRRGDLPTDAHPIAKLTREWIASWMK